MAEHAWLIPLCPLAAFCAIALGVRRGATASAALTIFAVGAAFFLAVVVLSEAVGGARTSRTVAWLPLLFNPGGALGIGFQVDGLTAVMLVVVSSVSLLVQVYSLGYLVEADGERDEGFVRYFAVMNLFTAAMLGLVLANNLLLLFMCWELVGLSSYLLIGHYAIRSRPLSAEHRERALRAAQAAKKAFLVTRLGDVGLLLGILFLFAHTGTLDFAELSRLAASGRIPESVLTVGLLLIFCGAAGKSAQFPLHVWLPDAMEGPTPVSALIHAATMVAAGVYLMARTFPLLEHSPVALGTVAAVGAVTALLAATMGLVARDIKRVLAYSTMSQLGYMMLAIGVGAMTAGMFHLFTHAFFKALLFLCAGSVIHLVGTNDLFRMGGLTRWRPVSALAMTVAALSLAGVFPLSGFWSKDEILIAVLARHPALFVIAVGTVFLTAFYMFRVVFLTFSGTYRGHELVHEGAEHGRPHPEPVSMTVPLIILLVPTIVAGLWGSPLLGNGFGELVSGHEAHVEFSIGISALSTLLAAGGVGLAWLMYGRGDFRTSAEGRPRSVLDTLLQERYYVDRVYDWGAGRLGLGVGALAARFDSSIIDGAVNGVGSVALSLGGGLRRLQSGQVQTYAWVLFTGTVVLFIVVAGLRPA